MRFHSHKQAPLNDRHVLPAYLGSNRPSGMTARKQLDGFVRYPPALRLGRIVVPANRSYASAISRATNSPMTKHPKTMLFLEDSDEYFLCDTIRYQENLWIVPEWFESKQLKQMRPARIIRLEGLAHQRSQIPGVTWVITSPLPKDVFDGKAQPQPESGIVMVDMPEIMFPASYLHH